MSSIIFSIIDKENIGPDIFGEYIKSRSFYKLNNYLNEIKEKLNDSNN